MAFSYGLRVGKYEVHNGQRLKILDFAIAAGPAPHCNAGNAAKAKRYFARLPVSQQTPMAQLCLRNKIALP